MPDSDTPENPRGDKRTPPPDSSPALLGHPLCPGFPRSRFSLALAITGFVPEDTGTRMIGALWAMISSIVVMQDTRSATISTAWLRILGSLIGAVFFGNLPSGLPVFHRGYGDSYRDRCPDLRTPPPARPPAACGPYGGYRDGDLGCEPRYSADGERGDPVFPTVIIGSSVAVAAAWVWQYLFPGE